MNDVATPTARKTLILDAASLAAQGGLLGQILTFCAFLGGFGLTAMVETHGSEAFAKVPHLGYFLGGLAMCALCAAFFALLGIITLTRLRHSLALTPQTDMTDAEKKTALIRWADLRVFAVTARILTLVTMGVGIVAVALAAAVKDWLFAGVLILIGFGVLLVPWLLLQVARRYMLKHHDV